LFIEERVGSASARYAITEYIEVFTTASDCIKRWVIAV